MRGSALKKKLAFLTSPVLLHYCLPLMMVFLIIGTVSQKYIGLYQATQMFFSDPVIWIGAVPVPGFPIVLGVIFVNLLAKLAFDSPWTKRHAGIIVSHIAVAFLFFGGLFTAVVSEEGFVDLAPGKSKAYVTDYHHREFVMRDDQDRVRYAIPLEAIAKDQTLTIPDQPFALHIYERCQNCKIDIRENFVDGAQYQGMAAKMTLSDAPLKNKDEENMAGLNFGVQTVGADNDDDEQIFTVLEDVPRWPEVQSGGETFRFAVEKQKRALPFSIELLSFKKTTHPGMEMARAYESRVRISDEFGQWDSLIKMNEPLRYRGYTLFQSSFIRTPNGDVSVLAIVKNSGRSFPYIAGIILAIGLMLHLYIRRR